MIGRTLSHFRIVARLGEGGMGVVYRAEDEKLHRPVALKVLPPEAVGDDERRLRLLREARAAASLSHPSIATIYEVDEDDGIVFIAMELIDGKTLRSLIPSKPLPIREALRIAIATAEGLAKAHQNRVVHRDLKPENVMVTADGQVKILDFGLAKLLERQGELTAEEASRLETISGEMTKQGRILGTAAYMSPEQARGQSVDHRSDLFAFGIVLYEMVTGKVPFHGPTPMDTLSAILAKPFSPAVQVNTEVPFELERILGKCLEKDPAERYQDTRDLVVDLRRLKRETDSQPLTRAATRSGSGAPTVLSPSAQDPTAAPNPVYGASHGERILTPTTAADRSTAASGTNESDFTRAGDRAQPSRRAPRMRLGLLVAGSIVLVSGVAWLGWRAWSTRPSARPARELNQRQVLSVFETDGVHDVSISPDGKYMVITRSAGLTIRHLETGEIRQIPLPEGQDARRAVWTTDGTRLLVSALCASEKVCLWSIPLVTGAPRLFHEGVWHRPIPSPDGRLLAMGVGGDEPGLWVMDPEGGSPHKLFTLSAGEWNLHIAWAPNSRRIAYQRTKLGPSGGVGIIESRDVEGGPVVPILTSAELALPFGDGGGLAWLPDARLLFSMTRPNRNSSDADLYSLLVDPTTGSPEGMPERLTSWANGRLAVEGASADGKTLLVQSDQAQNDVWVGDLEQDGRRLIAPRRLTLDNHQDRPMFWMPDSWRIVFSSDRNGSLDLLTQDLEGGSFSPLMVGPRDTPGGVLTPQRNSFYFAEVSAGDPKAKEMEVKRADLSGGSVESLFRLPNMDVQVDCPTHPEAPCLISELQGKEATFYEMDPAKGKGKAIARLTISSAPWFPWALSPDGKQVAFLEGTPTGNPLRILTLSTGSIHEIPDIGRTNIQGITWAPDGSYLFGGNQNELGKSFLFRVDLQGNAVDLVESRLGGQWIGNPLPSPDGRHLAYQNLSITSDYWLLEGF